VGLGRVELPTNGLGNRCSIHLSYRPAQRSLLLDRLSQQPNVFLPGSAAAIWHNNLGRPGGAWISGEMSPPLLEQFRDGQKENSQEIAGGPAQDA
jgi:hypothetical protein